MATPAGFEPASSGGNPFLIMNRINLKKTI